MINNPYMWPALIAAFFLVAIAARQIGDFFCKLNLPLITGFLFTGILAGPYLLKIIPVHAIEKLRFVDAISLAFIAFAAGNELFVRQLRSQFKAIHYLTSGLVLSTFTIGSFSFFLLSEFLPFTNAMPSVHRLGVAILAGAILVARSPSSAIAVVNELRAKGPFTKTAIGVTVIMDVVVIAFFSINASIAATLMKGRQFDLRFILHLAFDLGLSVLLGYLLAKAIQFVLSKHLHRTLKTAFILAAGYGVFVFSEIFRQFTQAHTDFEVLLEPLLVCLVSSFLITNYSHYRAELMKALHDIAPVVYIAFFTLTGASLTLDILVHCWTIAIALFVIRLIGIFIGTFCGGFLAGLDTEHNKISWMCYITQAGVGLGLAKKVAVQFPEWGPTFATIIIAVIVLNQIVGPPFFKWALYLAKEVHPRADEKSSEGIRDAVIFGLEGESIALARLLQSNNWEVKIVTTQVQYVQQTAADAEIEIHPIDEFNLQTLTRIGVGRADSIVAMLSDEENYKICEVAYENFGTRNLIVRLHNRRHFKRFFELGALVVEPSTALVNLMDQFVRSPSAASLLLGLEQGREVIEFELRNPDLQGIAIRDLHLPLDLHILSVRRHGQLIVSGGFTALHVGDWLTVVGSRTSLEQMMLQFEESQDHAIAHMVGMAASKEMASKRLEKEVEEIIHERDNQHTIRFDRLIEESIVLDIDGGLDYDQFFNQVADIISVPLNLPPETLFRLLIEREEEISTALRPDLAIPHIIIEGENTFFMLLARCKDGIYFSNLAPKVQAVFVLVGTRDQRDYHLYALSAIAEIVQQPHFQEKWLKAKNEKTLRNIAGTRKNR
jgi:Trk K+ transport system NAD-binding subunit/Kef-type K+ transport system membrane component KefB/mannitol/fructose-specific phosphotransferase system IIA component (Ntr-type)